MPRMIWLTYQDFLGNPRGQVLLNAEMIVAVDREWSILDDGAHREDGSEITTTKKIIHVKETQHDIDRMIDPEAYEAPV